MSRDGWMKKKANASDDNGWAERVSGCAFITINMQAPVRLRRKTEKNIRAASRYLRQHPDVNICVKRQSCAPCTFCVRRGCYPLT